MQNIYTCGFTIQWVFEFCPDLVLVEVVLVSSITNMMQCIYPLKDKKPSPVKVPFAHFLTIITHRQLYEIVKLYVMKRYYNNT